MFTIHPFEPTNDNYEAIVAIEHAVWPGNPHTVASFKHGDTSRDPNYLFQRLVVREGDQVVAFGDYQETPWSYQPGKYLVSLAVHPDYERCGIGTAFYEYVMGCLTKQELKPAIIISNTREDKPQAIRFLQKRGFEQVMRWPESFLEVTTFEPAQFVDTADRVARQGIKIYSVSELKAIDPNWQAGLYELDWACTLDEPLPDPPTKLPLEQYVKQVLDHPNFLPQACFIALDGNQYVGLTQLYRNPADQERLNSGFTGVLSSHRRRGIATALKLRAIEFAKQHGVKTIKTNNEEHNPMYNLNMALGFKPAPAWLAFKKIISENERRSSDHEQ